MRRVLREVREGRMTEEDVPQDIRELVREARRGGARGMPNRGRE